MLTPQQAIQKANSNFAPYASAWVEKELYGLSDDSCFAPPFMQIFGTFMAIAALNCNTLSITDQQCIVGFLSQNSLC